MSQNTISRIISNAEKAEKRLAELKTKVFIQTPIATTDKVFSPGNKFVHDNLFQMNTNT